LGRNVHGTRTAILRQNFPIGTEEYHEKSIVIASILADSGGYYPLIVVIKQCETSPEVSE
jgi:hypothetical protein